MKHLLIGASLSLCIALPSLAAGPQSSAPHVQQQAEASADIIAHVNGLVCDFCAIAFEKVFSKKPAVASVDVDLAAKTISLMLRPGKTLSDAEIKTAVIDAGYALVSIDRPRS